jgi:hypothetical protein
VNVKNIKYLDTLDIKQITVVNYRMCLKIVALYLTGQEATAALQTVFPICNLRQRHVVT